MPPILIRHALEESNLDNHFSDQEPLAPAALMLSMRHHSRTPNPPSSVPASSLAGSDCESVNDIDDPDTSNLGIQEAPSVGSEDEWNKFPVWNHQRTVNVSKEPSCDGSPSSNSDSDSENSQPAKKRQKSGKSTAYTRAALHSVVTGKFKVDEGRWAAYETKIKLLDPNAVMDPEEPMYIRHSVCGETFKMRQPYDIKNFKTHVEARTCQLRKPGASRVGQKKHLKGSTGAGMMPLTAFAGFKRTSNRSASTSDLLEPSDAHNPLPSSSTGSNSSLSKTFAHICPGLSEQTMPGVDKYILRTSYIGGGSRSYTHFAMTLYAKPYNILNDDQKQKVQSEAHGNVASQIDESRMIVFSSTCTRLARKSTDGTDLRACVECTKITKDPGFKDALRYEAKPNQQFTNRRWMKVTSGMHFAKAHGVYEIIVGNVGV